MLRRIGLEGRSMNLIQKFILVFLSLVGLVFYVATTVLPQPSFWTTLTARETVTIISSSIDTQRDKRPARPAIAVRDTHGEISTLQGYPWMSTYAAARISDAAVPNSEIRVARWNGMLWRGIHGAGDSILLGISALSAILMLTGLFVAIRFRPR